MATVLIQGDKLSGTPQTRAVKVPAPAGYAGSVYRVEVLEAAPRFNRGDGRDGGRNILAAVLIGIRWTQAGYVIGQRGDWFAYTEYPFQTKLVRPREGARRRRVAQYVPSLTGGRRATVREAAQVLVGAKYGKGAPLAPPDLDPNLTGIQRATELVAKMIRGLDPGFWNGVSDLVGHKVNIHYNDGEFAATVNWETRDWCDYDFLDTIDAALAREGLPFAPAYLSSYELGLEDMS